MDATTLQELQIERTPMFNRINRVGKILKKAGIDPFKLDADKIIKKAKKRAGYKGSLPGQTEEGLKRLVRSINQDAQPNTFGAIAAKTLFERTLYGRLKIEQVLSENPEIENREIKEPIFIIGMPRTGTTILHAMLHEDPAHRSPLAWECLFPYPVPVPDTYHNNPQKKQVEKNFRQLFKLIPDFQVKHYMDADTPQECLAINIYDFNSYLPATLFSIPTYQNWFLNDADKLSTLRFHKRFLQYLQSGGVKAERWLLKSPVHMMRLQEIFEVYPDARIIITHRHPSNVIASTTSLISSVHSLYSDHEDPYRTGMEQIELWSNLFNEFLETRKKLGKEDQIIDVKFDDFVSDQTGVAKHIYDHFNLPLSDDTLNKFKRFIELNPKDKKGVHKYSLKDFGLDEKLVSDKFAFYIDFLKQL